MTERRHSEHQRKGPQGKTYHGVASQKGGAWAAAGRTAYRDEFQLDNGPDADEPLDLTESGHEF